MHSVQSLIFQNLLCINKKRFIKILLFGAPLITALSSLVPSCFAAAAPVLPIHSKSDLQDNCKAVMVGCFFMPREMPASAGANSLFPRNCTHIYLRRACYTISLKAVPRSGMRKVEQEPKLNFLLAVHAIVAVHVITYYKQGSLQKQKLK